MMREWRGLLHMRGGLFHAAEKPSARRKASRDIGTGYASERGLPQLRRRRLLAGSLLAGVAGGVPSPEWYLPGVTPVQYQQGQKIPLFVNKLTSVKTQLPYRYYTLPYCTPPNLKEARGNLGASLMGDVVENSPYEVHMLENSHCQSLCQKTLTAEDKKLFKLMIDEDYQVNWILDNLPGTTKYSRKNAAKDDFTYMVGFPVGLEQRGRYFLHNHAKIIIQYHSSPQEFTGFRIVGFEVEPHSLVNQGTECSEGSSGGEGGVFDLDANEQVVFTYDVNWQFSEDTWSGRWERYMKGAKGKIHWFSILNSLMIVLFLSSMVAMILLRTLHRDISRYNEIATSEDSAEETGWKLVHGDVFRKPVHSKMLACSVGAGVQLFGMSMVVIVFSCLGLLSPQYQGYLLQSMLLLFVLMGSLAGYYSARLYKMFNGQDWKATTLLTAFWFPGVAFLAFFVINLFIWSIWQHQFYYLFGFLFLVLIILVVTCIEISIALVYFQLTSEDYHWWWRSFFSSGSSGLYVFLYALLYKATRMQIDDFIPSLVYVGYMALMSYGFFLLTGAVGLLGAFSFVKTIYGSIKID
eukprot:g4057.t1